jgi:hypothetical protein
MSWIHAFCSRDASSLEMMRFPEPPIRIFTTVYGTIGIGGNPATCSWGVTGDGGWVIAGTGLMPAGEDFSIMNSDDWASVVPKLGNSDAYPDGHYIVARWGPDKIEFIADQLGLRTLYFATKDEKCCLSTRLDWVARSMKMSEIDYDNLGGGWLLYNQIDYTSGIKNIERLGPAGSLAIRQGKITVECTSRPFLPSFEPVPVSDAIRCLNRITLSALQPPYIVSLGLSGGLDSRALLAMCASRRCGGFATHTFGDRCDPDVAIARKISGETGIPGKFIDEPLRLTEETFTGMKEFVCRTMLTEPVTAYPRLRHFPSIRTDATLMLDGGFGELSRRQYLNRAVRLGAGALGRRDAGALIPYFRHRRGDFFTPDINAAFHRGAVNSLQAALDSMPDVAEIGKGNFTDLLAVRTRIPNFGSPEQARLDDTILNFMPMVQPSFLRLVFGIPEKCRSNASLHRSIIAESFPELARFPLAKGGLTSPYHRSTAMALIALKAKSRFIRGYSDPGPEQLLNGYREYIEDLSASAGVASEPAYNGRVIREAVMRYYNGDRSQTGTVSWWLTFELWKQSIHS